MKSYRKLLGLTASVFTISACGSLPRAERGSFLEENAKFSARATGDSILISFSDTGYHIPAEVYRKALACATEFDYAILTGTDVLRQTLEYIDGNNDRLISEGEIFSATTSKRKMLMLSSIRDEAEIDYMENHPEKTAEELCAMCERKYGTRQK